MRTHSKFLFVSTCNARVGDCNSFDLCPTESIELSFSMRPTSAMLPTSIVPSRQKMWASFFFLLCVTFTGLMSNQKESRASVYGKLHSKPTVPQLTTQRKRFSMRCVVFRNIIEAGNSLIGILRKIHRAIKVNVSKHHFPVTISWNIASCSMTFRWCNRLIK